MKRKNYKIKQILLLDIFVLGDTEMRRRCLFLCLYPLLAVSYKYHINGEIFSKVQITKKQDLFIEQNKNIYFDFQKISLKCENCFECLQQKANEWAFRIYNESQLYEENCFITLTYANDEELLNKRDIQLFLKRLRKAVSPRKIRFFACGEYGSKRLRPHYHLIIFNFIPTDLEFFYEDKGIPIFKSKFIENIWKKGFISVGFVSLDSSKYCAKYMQKLSNHNKKIKLLTDFFGEEKPFTLMSNRPGIGAKYIEQNLNVLETDKIFIKGKYIKIPRYYLVIAEEKLGLYLKDLKDFRKIRSSLINITEDELRKKRKKFEHLFDN